MALDLYTLLARHGYFGAVARINRNFETLKSGLVTLSETGNIPGTGEDVITQEDLAAAVADLTEMIGEVEDDVTTLSNTVSDIQSNITTISGEITSINATIATIQSSLATVEATIEGIQSSITTINSTLNTHASRLGTLELDVGNLESDVSTFGDDITNLQGRMTTAEGNITTLQGSVSTAQSNISNLQGRMTTTEGNIVTLQGSMSTAQSNISNLQGSMSTAQSNISNLQGRMTTAEGSITTLQSSVSTLQTTVSGIQTTLTTKMDKVASTSSEEFAIYDGSGGQVVKSNLAKSTVTTHLSSTSNPHSTTAAQVGAYTTSQIDAMVHTATANPTKTSDSAHGYQVGYRWINTSNRTSWQCINSSVGAAVWTQINLGFVDVRDWGARGDGVTDDLAAIQAAIDSINPDSVYGNYDDGKGGVVYIPKCSVYYRTTGPIKIYTGIALLGDDINSTTIVMQLSDADAKVMGICMKAVGSGYTSTPTVQVIDDAGNTSCQATAVLVNDTVNDIIITNQGSGYHVPPRVIISGGGGTGAEAIAVLYPAIQLTKSSDPNNSVCDGFSIERMLIRAESGNGIGHSMSPAPPAGGMGAQGVIRDVVIKARGWGIYLGSLKYSSLTGTRNGCYLQSCLISDLSISGGHGAMSVAGNANTYERINADVGPWEPAAYPPNPALFEIVGAGIVANNLIAENVHDPFTAAGYYFSGNRMVLNSLWYEATPPSGVGWIFNDATGITIDNFTGGQVQLRHSTVFVQNWPDAYTDFTTALDIDGSSDMTIMNQGGWGLVPWIDHPQVRVLNYTNRIWSQHITGNTNPTTRNLLVNGDFRCGLFKWQTTNATVGNDPSTTYDIVDRASLADYFQYTWVDNGDLYNPSGDVLRLAKVGGKALKVAVTSADRGQTTTIARTEVWPVPTEYQGAPGHLGFGFVINSTATLAVVINGRSTFCGTWNGIGTTAVQIPAMGYGSSGDPNDYSQLDIKWTFNNGNIGSIYRYSADATCVKSLHDVLLEGLLVGGNTTGVTTENSALVNIYGSVLTTAGDGTTTVAVRRMGTGTVRFRAAVGITISNGDTLYATTGGYVTNVHSGDMPLIGYASENATSNTAFNGTWYLQPGGSGEKNRYDIIPIYGATINTVLLENSTQYLYYYYTNVNDTTTGLYFYCTNAGVGVAVAIDIWNGSSWVATTVTDGTSGFTQDGKIRFTYAAGTWKRLFLPLPYIGSALYWFRIKSTTTITTPPTLKTRTQAGRDRLVETEAIGTVYLHDIYLTAGPKHNKVPEMTVQREWATGNVEIMDSAAPITGTWKRGDRVINSAPSASGNEGWVCVSGGSPGTWKTFGTIGS